MFDRSTFDENKKFIEFIFLILMKDTRLVLLLIIKVIRGWWG